MSLYTRAWCLIALACCALPHVYAVALTTSSPASTSALSWSRCQEASSIVSYFTQPEYTSAAYAYCSSILQIPPVTVTAVQTQTVHTTEYDVTYACTPSFACSRSGLTVR